MQQQILIVGATSGIGQALAAELRPDHEIWSASRSTNAPPQVTHHIKWDTRASPFPADEALPNRLDGLVYCPGSISLQPFSRLSDATFLEDFEINLMGAVRAIRGALPGP